MLHNSRICLLQCSSSQGNELSQSTLHWTILPFNNWNIWWLTQTCRCVFTWLCQCHLEFVRAIGPSFFYLGHFSLSKIFNHITKDANIFHLMLGGSCKLNYFMTSNHLGHTSHHHKQSITSCWFLTYKYGQPTTCNWLWTWRDFDIYFEPTRNPIIFTFFFFTPLNIFLIYDVFFNKVLQDLSFCLSFPITNHICSFIFFHIN